MKVLAIDSASEILSVALQSETGFAETTIMAGLKASEYLMPAVDALVALARAPRRFDLLVCMRGPGSFTGLRIAMATAKGLAAGSGGALVTIPTLEAMAYGLSVYGGVVVPVIDARKRRFYAALFREGDRLSEDMDVTAEALAATLAGYDRVLLTGPAAPLLVERLGERRGWSVDPSFRRGWAASLLKLGVDRFLQSGGEPDDAGPTYLRPSEAELSTPGGESRG